MIIIIVIVIVIVIVVIIIKELVLHQSLYSGLVSRFLVIICCMIIVDYQLMLKSRLYTMDMLQEEKHNLEKTYNLEQFRMTS